MFQVVCDSAGITVSINFAEPFDGVIYSKGHFSEGNCRYAVNALQCILKGILTLANVFRSHCFLAMRRAVWKIFHFHLPQGKNAILFNVFRSKILQDTPIEQFIKYPIVPMYYPTLVQWRIQDSSMEREKRFFLGGSHC